jgi:hypothetical protein
MVRRTRVIILLVACTVVIFFTHACHAGQENLRLGLIDCVAAERWVYKPFIDVAESAGFDVDYLPLDQVMDKTPRELSLTSYQALFFIFGNEFFGNLDKSLLVNKILRLLGSYSVLENRVIGLIFPSFRVAPQSNILAALAPVFDRIGLKTPLSVPDLVVGKSAASGVLQEESKRHIDAFFHTTNLFLSVPIDARPLDYHTTLNQPRHGTAWNHQLLQQLLTESGTPLYLLPLRNQGVSESIARTVPYGLCWNNKLKNNHVFVSSATIFSFAGISENFHFCPINPKLKKEIHTLIQQMMADLKELVVQRDRSPADAINKVNSKDHGLELPTSIAQIGDALPEHDEKLRKVAWMELAVFYDPDNFEKMSIEEQQKARITQAEQQDLLIDYIFKSGMDALWISITPNIYYSPIAKMVKQDRAQTTKYERNFLQALGDFTKKLKQVADHNKLTIPKIILGFEVANNLYSPNLPKKFAIDLYGNTYDDLPAPLDRNFWRNEVETPLEIFLRKWKDPKVSNGIPISGVMLDLEMYCRKRTGTFFSTMGFDADSFERFKKQRGLKANYLPVHDRVKYLMDKKLSGAYFKFLSEQAAILGKQLREGFCKKIPDCAIMCYTPHILANWFYKGLCKGLSQKDSPLYLFTFNSEFVAHKGWFEENDIPVSHGSVLLLSKLQNPQDYVQVQDILKTHHSVWFNRFSRFVETYNPSSWVSVEQSPMGPHEINEFFSLVQPLK